MQKSPPCYYHDLGEPWLSFRRSSSLSEEEKREWYDDLVISDEELASFWHLPHELFTTSGIFQPAISPVIFEGVKMQHIELGSVIYQGRPKSVYLAYEDRVDHINIIGRTRVGKSTFLHNLIHQDIANGKTVAVIDPHGRLIDSILASSIPSSREKDVVLFDVADTQYPVGLNFLSVPKGVEPYIVAEQALTVIRKLFEDQWGDHMEAVLSNTLGALVYYPKATIYSVSRFLTEPDFRDKVLTHVTDFVIMDYWQKMFSPERQQSTIMSIVDRINQFYRNPTLRRITCQPHSLNFHKIMDSNKIFLASLRGIGETEANTLGALLISKFQIAGMSRGIIFTDPTPVYLYIDEAQNLINTSLGRMFSETKRYGISLVIANQYFSEISGKNPEVALGNVGANICFAVDSTSARIIAQLVQPEFSVEDLISLDRFNTVARIQVSGKMVSAFSMVSPAPMTQPNDATDRIERLRQQSRSRHGRSVSVVDEEINQHYQSSVGEDNKTNIFTKSAVSEQSETHPEDFWE